MKRNKLAKRFGIASLCLATAFSAFSGIASLGGNVALADEEGTAVTDFVETTTAKTVTQDENGLYIGSDEAYNATFKTVFTGNTTLNFRFPETITNEDGNATHPDSYYGEFRIKITDATDDSNSFFIRSMAYTFNNTYVGTSTYVNYGSERRKVDRSGNMLSSNTQNSASYFTGPFFLGYTGNAINSSSWKGQYNKEGSVSLVWDANGVLSVKSYTVNKSTWTQRVFAAFDGTDTFVKGSSWGLPKLSFPNGYKISVSSSVTSTLAFNTSSTKFASSSTVTDGGTDVLISSITSGGESYNFKTMTERPDSAYTKAYDTMSKGNLFLGWKNASGELYPTYADVSADFANYEAVACNYDIIDGASVRIAVGGESGLRFMTKFDVVNGKEKLESLQDGTIKFGTLIALTSALDETLDFTIANYQTVIDANGNVKKVENTKGLFAYEDKQANATYDAYSMALTNFSESQYATAYSARGYIELTYANGETKTIYTDYDATNNSRSIQQTAQNLMNVGAEEFATYSTEEQNVVKKYAGVQE